MSNRAIKEGKGQEALQHYNAALTAELPGSAAFVAVLFANRAAAHQSLGQATHAVADCLRATALSPAYSKVRCSTISIWWKSGFTFVSTSKLPLNPLLSWTKPCTECCDGQGAIICGIYIGCFAETVCMDVRRRTLAFYISQVPFSELHAVPAGPQVLLSTLPLCEGVEWRWLCGQAHSRLATVLSELKHRTGEADVLERLQALPVATPSEAAAVAHRLRAARAAAQTATPDHYKVIGIARDADAEEVSSAALQTMVQGGLSGWVANELQGKGRRCLN